MTVASANDITTLSVVVNVARFIAFWLAMIIVIAVPVCLIYGTWLMTGDIGRTLVWAGMVCLMLILLAYLFRNPPQTRG